MTKITFWTRIAAAVLSLAALPVSAATFTVTQTGNSGDGSLRTAVNNANNNPGPDAILFDLPGAGPHVIDLTGPLATISGPLSIHNDRNGDERVTVQRSSAATSEFRIFAVNSSSVLIAGITMSNGRQTGEFGTGGAIRNQGTGMTLRNCTLSGNAALRGGAIWNQGRLTVQNCTFFNNSANHGGAIWNMSTTFNTMRVTNSTFSGNSATVEGGAVHCPTFGGPYEVTNCTFSSNSAPTGGALYGAVSTANSIFLRGSTGENFGFNPRSRGSNLSDDAAGGDGTTGPGGVLNASGDVRNTPPQLGALADNGGLTFTHALLPASPAINAGNDATAPPRDQRNYTRSGVSDIGAFEEGGSPALMPGVVANVATRLPVGAGDNALIQGFTIEGGNSGESKKIMVRALGPWLQQFGISDALANPTLEIRSANNALLATNNNWRTTEVGGYIHEDQSAEIASSGLAPVEDLESAIIIDLFPGQYSAVVRGVGDTVGTGVVDAYDLTAHFPIRLVNVATRGFVQGGDKLMIAGFIVQDGPVKAALRGIGPSLTGMGIANALPDTTLELRDKDGVLILANDNWESDPTQKAELEGYQLQPSHELEAALIATIPAGQYTAQLRGKDNTNGIGVVEVYFVE